MSMIIRKFLLGSASAAVLAAIASPALAQDTSAEVEQGEDIVVTGIRGSIRASIDAKRNSDVIADVITAEDIGKFPDKNVAEALQRVPGIVVNREFGEGERVSLRGTSPNLTKTLVNGHTIATADWFILDQLDSTRSFNYLTLPAEIVGQIEVYKSPQADVEEGGVGGTINVHTRNPLDLDAFSVSASVQAVYSELADKISPQDPAGRRLSEARDPPGRRRGARLFDPRRGGGRQFDPDADRIGAVHPGARALRRQYRYPVPPDRRAGDQHHRALLPVRRGQFQPELSRMARSGGGRWRHADQSHGGRRHDRRRHRHVAPGQPGGGI
jgi:outer membrane receptor protein involved in Fe transport